jgi:hypothetical protein
MKLLRTILLDGWYLTDYNFCYIQYSDLLDRDLYRPPLLQASIFNIPPTDDRFRAHTKDAI